MPDKAIMSGSMTSATRVCDTMAPATPCSADGNVQTFYNDVSNAVQGFLGDGIDGIERYVLTMNLDAAQPGATQIMQKGLCTVYDQLKYNLEQADLGFQQLSSATLFYVPPAPVRALEGAAPVCDTHYTAQDEAEMDQQLQQLRQQISQTRRENRQLRSSINHLERDFMAAGSNDAFDSLASTLTQHGEGLQGDLDAIAAAAKQLQPLLQKAQQLKAGISMSSKDTNGSDMRMRQQLANSGLTSEALLELNSLLTAN